MKIALICDWYRPRTGGIERHLEELARHLAAAGHRVSVITPTPGPGDDAVTLVRIDAPRIPGVGLLCTPAGFAKLGDQIRRGGYDVVHIHSSVVSPAAYAAYQQTVRAGIPVVVTVHSIWGGLGWMFALAGSVCNFHRHHAIFSGVSERVARQLRDTLHVPAVVLPNAIDPSYWGPTRAVASGDEPVIVACAMRLAPRKRGASLLVAFQSACRRAPGPLPSLEIAGDGPERAHLERLASRLGIAHQVRFLGTLRPDEVRALFARSAFFVLPTVKEAFGLAALEAQAAGLPVIAMRSGGASAFIEHGEGGLLVDNDRELAEAISLLAADSALRQRLSAYNRARPVIYTWDRSLAAHEEQYGRAVRAVRLP